MARPQSCEDRTPATVRWKTPIHNTFTLLQARFNPGTFKRNFLEVLMLHGLRVFCEEQGCEEVYTALEAQLAEDERRVLIARRRQLESRIKRPITEYPIQIADRDTVCAICRLSILKGQRYHNGGWNRRAHVECVTSGAAETA